MADELDVTADFDAHVGDFVSNIELAINAAERFRDSIVADIEAIEAMHEALDDLPTEHLTNVSLVGEDQILEQVAEIREYLAALPDEKTIWARMATTGETGAASAGGAGDAASAINNLTDALDRNAESWARVENVGRDYSVMMGETIADANETSGALDRIFAVSADGAAEMRTAAQAVQAFNDGLERLPHYVTDLETSIRETGDAADALGRSAQDNLDQGLLAAFRATQTLDSGLQAIKGDSGDAGKAARDAGAAAGAAAGGWGLLSHNLQTFGGAAEMALGRQIPLVTSIAGWHLLLDASAEGIIALSGALIALGAAAAGMAPSFLDIYTNLKSTRDQIEAFGVEIKPFNSWFLNLQHAMQTQSIELFGEALLDMGKANTSVAGDIENVGEAIDRMGAKISEWISNNADFGETIKKGGEYAKDLGDILGNLIVIIDDLIRADSGIVSVRPGVLRRVHARRAAAVLGFSEALDRFLLVAHGILLWGGLLSSMLINVAVMFLRPVANMIAFVGGVQGASAAIKDFEVANDTAATPIQKLGIIVQTAWAGIASIGGATSGRGSAGSAPPCPRPKGLSPPPGRG